MYDAKTDLSGMSQAVAYCRCKQTEKLGS